MVDTSTTWLSASPACYVKAVIIRTDTTGMFGRDALAPAGVVVVGSDSEA